MKLKGIRVPHKKNTAQSVPVRVPVPKTVTIPMSMHIGRPAKPVVKRGDTVKVGQLIAEADGYISAPIHASVSGKVQKIDEITTAMGTKVAAVVIESDGLQEVSETVQPPDVHDLTTFVDAVRHSGSVGLGGAGFPTFVKFSFNNDLSVVDAVVINAAECEPYITSDTRTLLDRADEVFEGIALLKKYLKVKHYVIGIENNKPEAIAKARELAAKTDGVEVHVLPAAYPQGGEKVLVYNTLGRMIPLGGLPLDEGVVVINVTTLAFIAHYIKTGMPLVEKCLTVDGSAVKEPKNIIAPIGMSIADVLESAGGCKDDPAKVLYGGPMMGIAVPDLNAPVLKNTNAVIAMDAAEARPPRTTPCINCGACLTHCPLRLDPRAISKAYRQNDPAELKALHADLCMECGCCSYVCPAKRHLVQTNKLAKAVLREYDARQREKKEGAK